MYTATKANVRTAVAANEKGASEALNVAFFGGSIMGLTVASMGLFGVEFYFIILEEILKLFIQSKDLQWELPQCFIFSCRWWYFY